jgi:hypothetical protein
MNTLKGHPVVADKRPTNSGVVDGQRLTPDENNRRPQNCDPLAKLEFIIDHGA